MSPSDETMHRHPLTWPYRLAMSVIVAGALTFGSLLAYVFWPVQVVYVDTPMPVTPREVKPGEWVRLQVRYSKPYPYTALVGFMVASKGNVALLPVGLSALPPGEHGIGVFLQIPPSLPPDTYVVMMIVEHPVRLPIPAVFDRPVLAASEPFVVR